MTRTTNIRARIASANRRIARLKRIDRGASGIIILGGIGYKTSGVKAVALSANGTSFSSGSYEDVVSGKYPLARFLYLYINRAPGKALDPLVREFLKFVFSKEGQENVVKDGYLPLSAAIVKEELAKLQ